MTRADVVWLASLLLLSCVKGGDSSAEAAAVTNQTSQDYWFGPLHLPAGVGQQITVDDTSATSLYLTDDQVADAINNLSAAGKIAVTSAAAPFPRPTGTPELLHGDGSPEGSVFAPQGSVYMRRDQAGLYVKTTAVSVDTGWILNGSAELDFKQATADVTGITATTEAGATAVITGNSVTYDGSRVKVEFYAPEVVYVAGTGTNKVTLVFLRDTTVVGQAVILETGGTLVSGEGPKAECFDTPPAGAHTYSVKAFSAATSPNYTVKAGAGGSGVLVPAYLRVTKA